jgi:hypothetical protein
MKHIPIQEELERRVLHGLACEWENACWVLSSRDRVKMRQPLFSLSDMTARLGIWSGEKKEISISRSLALNHAWKDVREVLLHEMAHQYADQVLHTTFESPHGPGFRYACDALRIEPKSSARFKPMSNQTDSHRDRVLSRIKKLMSLAESRNRHEAEAAMAKAHELMKTYNIKRLRETTHRDFVSAFIGSPALRHRREAYYLANLLLEFYFVEGLWISAYVLEKGKMGRVLEISGTVENVEMAAYVHDFVENYIDMQWNRYNRSQGLNRYRQTDFAVGVVQGFGNKLRNREQKKTKTGSETSIVKVEDPLLRDFMLYKYPHTRSFRRITRNRDDKIMQDGYDIGEKLVIAKGLTQRQNSNQPALIPHKK